MAEVTSGTDLTVIILDEAEAGALAAVLHEYVVKGEQFAGHSGPIRRAYPHLDELAEAMGATGMGPHLGGKW